VVHIRDVGVPGPSVGHGDVVALDEMADRDEGRPMPNRSDIAWKAVALGAGAASAFVTRRLIRAVWKGAKGTEPPSNPASRSTTWKEAIAWAVSSGVALAVSRLVAQRGAAAAWKAKTGSYPRALEDVS
jgi:hypothetical protein